MLDAQNISIKIILEDHDMLASRSIRERVFVVEQKVPPEIEYDEFEETSIHILAKHDGQAVGTARWRKTDVGYKLERFAVTREARELGVGRAMVQFILDQIQIDQPVYLNSQVSAIGFYAALGFVAEGAVFYEADIPHRKMFYNLP